MGDHRAGAALLDNTGRQQCHSLQQTPLVVATHRNEGLGHTVGACRECLGYERTHLIARLDRETSGIILYKHRLSADTCKWSRKRPQKLPTFRGGVGGRIRRCFHRQGSGERHPW